MIYKYTDKKTGITTKYNGIAFMAIMQNLHKKNVNKLREVFSRQKKNKFENDIFIIEKVGVKKGL